VIGLPACIAATEPPTGIADSLASAPAGGTGEDDGRGAGGADAAAGLEAAGGECGAVECAGGECGGVECAGVECAGVECEPVRGAVDGIASGALEWLLIAPLLGRAALGASVLAAFGVAPVPHPAKASAAMPANPAPPPRTARRLSSARSDMVVPPVATTVPGPRSGLTGNTGSPAVPVHHVTVRTGEMLVTSRRSVGLLRRHANAEGSGS
jgi:hypothetical protein